ncbi:hypothetical protein OSB04_031195 [Centaurea solstitialis]|uniref:CCHC-type domain-containing protein n=1 Tax=Centaurea solstitialis TaxID=347529 RepID=A0AA38VU26_9ASTR|nr:hypothetical protein OSB04_031195 [Centaurea solstitialis]
MATSWSNSETTSVNNTVSVFLDNGTVSKPPRFNPSKFSLWKNRMMLFMEGIDSRYLTILRDGPFIPRVWDRFNKDKDGSFSEEDRSSATGRYILKAEKKYTEEDWKLVSLDTKENICTCIKTSKDLETMPLIVLFGTLVNYEQTKLQRKSLIRDIKSSSIAFMSENSKSKYVCIPQITFPASDSDISYVEDQLYSSKAPECDGDDESNDTSVDQLTDEMAMAGFSRKLSSRFRNGKRFVNGRSISKSTTCFNCGKKGHFSADCKSSQQSIRPSFVPHRSSKSGGP